MKKTISILVAGLLAAGMSLAAFAAYEPTEQVKDLGYAYTGDDAEDQTVDLGDVFADEETTREIPLVYGMFDAEPPEGKDGNDRLSEEDMGSIGVKMNEAEGKGLVTAGVDKNDGVIRLSFAEGFDGKEDADFEVTIYLVVAEERYEELGLTFTGTAVAQGNAEPTDATAPSAVPGNSEKPTEGNPDTGDSSFLGIALTAMVLAGAVIGLLARKRKK